MTTFNKLIPNMGDRYSITQNGIITDHLLNKIINTNSKKIHLYDENNNDKCLSVSAWIYITFGYTKCKHCNTKIYKSPRTQRCNDCLKSKDKKAIENISKKYCSNKLKISTKDLTEELYQMYKLNLQIKRILKNGRN